MILLVDNSNTRTKFALAKDGKLLPGLRSLPTADITPAALRGALDGWQFSRAVICSVVPQAAEALRAALRCPIREICAQSAPKLLRNYPQPETLGADRIANAAAVAALYPLPCIAIDLGTACTFDLVTPENGEPSFAGGIISPGLQTIADGLAAKAALLPRLEPTELATEPAPLGRSTRSALHAGLHLGYRGMLLHITHTLAAQLSAPTCAVITGGDAELFSTVPGLNTYIDKTLTLKGILQLTTDD